MPKIHLEYDRSVGTLGLREWSSTPTPIHPRVPHVSSLHMLRHTTTAAVRWVSTGKHTVPILMIPWVIWILHLKLQSPNFFVLFKSYIMLEKGVLSIGPLHHIFEMRYVIPQFFYLITCPRIRRSAGVDGLCISTYLHQSFLVSFNLPERRLHNPVIWLKYLAHRS